MEVAWDLRMDLDRVRQLRRLFDRFDLSGKGSLSMEDFRPLVSSLLRSEACPQVFSGLVSERWFQGEAMDFRHFVLWYQANGFATELIVPAERCAIRALARKHGLDAELADDVHRACEACRLPSLSSIGFSAFCAVIGRLLHLEPDHLGETRWSQFWQDARGSPTRSTITFENLLCWYLGRFGDYGRGLERGGSTFVSKFYRSFRPVSCFPEPGADGAAAGAERVCGMAPPKTERE